ncbi:amidase [Cohnella sp. JJ-181]|uniref:amidase n=1 Tax=Cohnella rhizoplanae TaxID=2974897 RepID=UPI0022FFA162|nr:amidase [Cohnella sp. JJ-181]CAI6068124.1 2-amino-5-chloromuconic acid deaminase [Cohnella sp. JJ-181]
MNDRWHAYIRQDIKLEPTGSGPLGGMSFAAKDVFAVRGCVPGAGSPDWARTHEAASSHARAIDLLLAGGAALNGLTHTDEMMYSLNGENYNYGTPINPKAEQRIPGGSSSGSAVAVAAGLADLAIGTDTGGSVRIPSSYCGIYGFRPTHGRVPLDGVVPLAPLFDTVGWMSTSARLTADAGAVLLEEDGAQARTSPRRLLVGKDALRSVDPATQSALKPLIAELASSFAASERIAIAREGLEAWMRIFKLLQGVDIWRTHGTWIERARPRFGPGTAERFEWTRTLSAADSARELQAMAEIRERLADLLGDDTVLAIPTATGPAPLRNTPPAEMELRRARTQQLSCIAGLGGLPQITLPWADVDGCPVGLSLLAGPGQDMMLLQWAADQAADRQAALDAAAGH